MSNFGAIAYLAPVFSPAIGGGVIYLELLAQGLINAGACEKFLVLTEKYPGTQKIEYRMDRKLEVHRKYPFRAGRSSMNILSYFQYFWQNICFLGLPISMMRHPVRILLVHGSFLNNPTFLWPVLRTIRLLSPSTRIVADLRDPKLPAHKIPRLRFFDLVISCSENISQPLLAHDGVGEKVRDIPIMVDEIIQEKEKTKLALAKYGLKGRPYIFNGSGLSHGKGVSRLFDLVVELRRQGRDLSLAIVGKRRYWESRFDVGVEEGWFHYLGQVPHDDVLSLAAGSLIDVNLSDVDSMPRHSLEAMMVGAKTLFPGNVPEFQRECPEHVASEDNIEDLASKVVGIVANEDGLCEYDIGRHSPDKVICEYVDVFRSVVLSEES